MGLPVALIVFLLCYSKVAATTTAAAAASTISSSSSSPTTTTPLFTPTTASSAPPLSGGTGSHEGSNTTEESVPAPSSSTTPATSSENAASEIAENTSWSETASQEPTLHSSSEHATLYVSQNSTHNIADTAPTDSSNVIVTSTPQSGAATTTTTTTNTTTTPVLLTSSTLGSELTTGYESVQWTATPSLADSSSLASEAARTTTTPVLKSSSTQSSNSTASSNPPLPATTAVNFSVSATEVFTHAPDISASQSSVLPTLSPLIHSSSPSWPHSTDERTDLQASRIVVIGSSAPQEVTTSALVTGSEEGSGSTWRDGLIPSSAFIDDGITHLHGETASPGFSVTTPVLEDSVYQTGSGVVSTSVAMDIHASSVSGVTTASGSTQETSSIAVSSETSPDPPLTSSPSSVALTSARPVSSATNAEDGTAHASSAHVTSTQGPPSSIQTPTTPLPPSLTTSSSTTTTTTTTTTSTTTTSTTTPSHLTMMTTTATTPPTTTTTTTTTMKEPPSAIETTTTLYASTAFTGTPLRTSTVLFELLRRPFLSRNGYLSANSIQAGSRLRESSLLNSFRKGRPVPPGLSQIVQRLQHEHNTSSFVFYPVMSKPEPRKDNSHSGSGSSGPSPDVGITSGTTPNEAKEHSLRTNDSTEGAASSSNKNDQRESESSPDNSTTARATDVKEHKHPPVNENAASDTTTMVGESAGTKVVTNRGGFHGHVHRGGFHGHVPVDSPRRRLYLRNFGRNLPWSPGRGLRMVRTVV